MELNEIITELEQLFQQPLKDGYKRKIIIWHDSKQEFLESINDLQLDDVQVIQYHYNNAFKVRYQIEMEYANQNILLYVPHDKDETADNPLIDIYLYSEFYLSDSTAILLRSLNLSEELRSTIEKYAVFFKNKSRITKFQKLVQKQFNLDKDTIQLCIIGSLLNCSADFNEILMTLIKQEVEAEGANESIVLLRKFEADAYFWTVLQQRFGYVTETPSLNEFISLLFMTYINETTTLEIGSEWKVKLLINKQNTRIFMETLMKNDMVDYDDLANKMYEYLQIQSMLNDISIEAIQYSGTFKEFDQCILSDLKDHLVQRIYNPDVIKLVIAERQPLHFFKQYEAEYTSIWSAIEFFEHLPHSNESTVNKLYNRYLESDYRVDQAYRKFYDAYDQLTMSDEFETLKNLIETIYVNDYLSKLSLAWSTAFSSRGTKWEIDDVKYQKNFFFEHMPRETEKPKECVVVIISDGLRYEVAEELKDKLIKQGKIRPSSLTLTSMQSVMPSITELGMAAMLPRQNLLKMNDHGKVFIADIDSNGLENRKKILNNELKRTAYRYDEIIHLNRTDFKKLFTDKGIVYIYHNTIDAVGDHAASEKDVFKAVNQTFDELNKLIAKINQGKISRIKQLYITSDHGFLYQVSPISEIDKLSREKLNVIKEKRRYMLSKEPLNIDGTLTFDISSTVNTPMYATVPRGNMRFKTQGAGVNYVHGGAMPQEFIVPLLHYKVTEIIDIETVSVICRNLNKTIKNHDVNIDLMQIEKVEGDILPRQCKVYFEDANEQVISNEIRLVADSTADKIDMRTYKVQLSLMNKTYQKNEPITLIIENEQTPERNEYTFYVDIVE
ncbi:BREX-1 system phosphatase PglZ type A [Turicibacter bilis]|uniref:BREX-1 system phosphatase PglZ type A n=1 Tax=Turicibacter bilis TaxID=2735723 RepID=UPI0031BB6910